MIQRVKDIMKKDVVYIEGITKVSTLIETMKKSGNHAILVHPRNDEDVHGIVTLRDVARKVVAPMKKLNEVHVYEIMSKPVLTVSADWPVAYAAQFLTNFNTARAPVTENDKVVGMVSLNGIVLNFK